MVGEGDIRRITKGDIIQLQRKEYFIVDRTPEIVLIQVMGVGSKCGRN